eukprot:gnl/MRDRNA2_/MRDRNA2_123632_c0_seq1.p1 gnl/MRDRNA2_/MRDRNA2_123632_c0~~gnl/MRDRNA2_/MRDRNA2_123632_c0_seq1.p1  ORF type:complete len:330 (-),score=74.12 gnl/MRDRNA2_/MRDRNA2_123632_c0_seq1:85-1011(-)
MPGTMSCLSSQAELAMSMMIGVVHGGASRHVAAAVAAAIMRCKADLHKHVCDDADLIIEDVQQRMQAIIPALAAQSKAARSSGVNVHSARGLITPEQNLRANAAKHVGFETEKPFAQMTNQELRRRQRRGKKSRWIPVDEQSQENQSTPLAADDQSQPEMEHSPDAASNREEYASPQCPHMQIPAFPVFLDEGSTTCEANAQSLDSHDAALQRLQEHNCKLYVAQVETTLQRRHPENSAPLALSDIPRAMRDAAVPLAADPGDPLKAIQHAPNVLQTWWCTLRRDWMVQLTIYEASDNADSDCRSSKE